MEKFTFSYGWKFYPLRVIFPPFWQYIPNLSKKSIFQLHNDGYFHPFCWKVDIATIFLHNLILGGYLNQIGRYFHLMRLVLIRVEITTRFHQKPPLKQGG